MNDVSDASDTKPGICDLCRTPNHLDQVEHPVWCTGVKKVRSELETLRTAYEEIKRDHEMLKRQHAELAKAVGPSIRANMVFR